MGQAGRRRGWTDRGAIPATTIALLHEIGRNYPPFMVANAAALRSGADTMSCQIEGAIYSQGSFGYQGKCPTWRREQYAALNDADCNDIDARLAGTGCEILFA